MHRLIQDFGLDPRQIAQNVGATLAEVELLNEDHVCKALKLSGASYSKA